MHFVERVRQSDHEKVDCRGHQIAMGSHCPDLVKLLNIKAGDIGSSVAIESKSPEVVYQGELNARALSSHSERVRQHMGSQICSKVSSEYEFAARCDTENTGKANAPL